MKRLKLIGVLLAAVLLPVLGSATPAHAATVGVFKTTQYVVSPSRTGDKVVQASINQHAARTASGRCFLDYYVANAVGGYTVNYSPLTFPKAVYRVSCTDATHYGSGWK